MIFSFFFFRFCIVYPISHAMRGKFSVFGEKRDFFLGEF